MNIIYSPEFNSTSYVDLEKRKKQLLGLKVCGSRELLFELELRVGIVAQDLSEPERLVAFHDAIKTVVKDTIFAKSFETDEIGVTRQLMTWCDKYLETHKNVKQWEYMKKKLVILSGAGISGIARQHPNRMF